MLTGATDNILSRTDTNADNADIPGVGMAATLVLDKEKLQHNKKKEQLKETESCNEQSKVEVKDDYNVEEKKIAVENLSGMLAQLLAMARVIMTKSPTETCPCGHVCGRGGNVTRSPASGRCQGILGIGRSPGNARSPRTGKLAAAGGQSPGINSPGAQNNTSARRSLLPPKSQKDRGKPASAKRLIPENPEPLLSKVRQIMICYRINHIIGLVV